MRRRVDCLGIVVLLLLLATGLPARAEEILRDPTRPYSAPRAISVSRPQFKVNAIIMSDTRQVAIVNGKRVGVGALVGGARVVSISRNEIVLDFDGQPMTLTLNGVSPE